MRDEKDKELERFLFDFGRHVLGKGSGGMIVKLKEQVGISSAWNQIKMAAEKSDPREYVGAILRKHMEQKPPAMTEAERERLWQAYKAKIARTT